MGRALGGARVEGRREVVKPHEIPRIDEGIRRGDRREHPAAATLVDEVRIDGTRTDEETAPRQIFGQLHFSWPHILLLWSAAARRA